MLPHRLARFSLNKSVSFPRSTFSRPIHTHLAKSLSNGVYIAEIRNNRREEETKEAYEEVSFRDFYNLLKQEHFYIYVDKAYFNQSIKRLHPCHISSFLTDGL